MGFLRDFISKLPDAFNKSETSNIGKFLSIIGEQLDAIKSTFETVESWRDINNAEGAALDDLGDNINQKRGMATDDIYRVMIRGKSARIISDGTTNRIIEALESTLNCPVTDINIQFGYERESEQESAMISITKAPLTALNQIGMSSSQFIQIVNNVIAGGIKLSDVNLEGTFSFSSGSLIETSEFGFADIEATTGGTLGGVFMPEDNYRIPI